MSWLVYYWWTCENIGYLIDLLSKLLKKLRCVSWMNFQGVAFSNDLGIMKNRLCNQLPCGKWLDITTVEQCRKGPWLFRLQKGGFYYPLLLLGLLNYIPLQEFRIPIKQPRWKLMLFFFSWLRRQPSESSKEKTDTLPETNTSHL